MKLKHNNQKIKTEKNQQNGYGFMTYMKNFNLKKCAKLLAFASSGHIDHIRRVNSCIAQVLYMERCICWAWGPPLVDNQGAGGRLFGRPPPPPAAAARRFKRRLVWALSPWIRAVAPKQTTFWPQPIVCVSALLNKYFFGT